VTPVHPVRLFYLKGNGLSSWPTPQKDAVLEGYATVSSIVNLEEPSATSISIITPPKVGFIDTAMLAPVHIE
jgi:hypothetical protein